MELHDQHVHSHHSVDSETPPAHSVRAAIEAGLAGLTFAEHFDTHPDDWPTCRYDDGPYTEEIDTLRAEFADRIAVGKGIEICYQPARWGLVLDFLADHRFDMVMLSVHWTPTGPIHEPAWWDQFVSIRRACNAYFRTVLDAVDAAVRLREQGVRVFDVLGHMDLVKRYAHLFRGAESIPLDIGLIEEICVRCVAADLVPEVNTSTIRQHGLGPMPAADIIERYTAAGGTAMPLGSDAHRAEHVGAGLDEAADLLRSCGIAETVVFSGRTGRVVPLD
ncbi:MAG: histidinol-phosphatase HisJ family protein [Phycisphaerales bacterium]|nr:histidinol-phosphatase HisJ family protein [Phycisphaerales bacterium]